MTYPYQNLVDQKQEQDNNNAVNEPVQDNPEADQESHNQGIHLSVLGKQIFKQTKSMELTWFGVQWKN